MREYAQDERVEIKVNKLTSTKTQLVRSTRKNESIAASARAILPLTFEFCLACAVTAAVRLLQPAILQAGERHQRRREPRRGAPRLGHPELAV